MEYDDLSVVMGRLDAWLVSPFDEVEEDKPGDAFAIAFGMR